MSKGTELRDNKGFITFSFKQAENIEDEVTPARLNAIIQAVNANNIFAVVGGFLRGKSKGRVLEIPSNPAGGSIVTYPYEVTDASTHDSAMVTVRPGTHNSFMPQIYGEPLIPPATNPVTPPPKLTLGPEATFVYVQFDFTYNGALEILIGDASINSTNDPSIPTSTLTPSGDSGGGTGTFYEALAGVSVNTTNGNSVSVYQLVKTIRTFYICGGYLVVTS